MQVQGTARTTVKHCSASILEIVIRTVYPWWGGIKYIQHCTFTSSLILYFPPEGGYISVN